MAEGIRFKTGFLPSQVSYSDMGRAFGERIADNLQDLADADSRRKAQLNANMGFSKALSESSPTGLTEKYQAGAQILLEKYQEAAITAQRTGKSSDVDDYVKLKRDFTEFKNVASAKSAMDSQTMVNIVNQQIPGMSGSVEDNLALYRDSNQASYIWNEETSSLMVGVGNQFVPWQSSNIGDLNDVYVPKMLWTGTEYMPEKVGDDIYSNLLQPKLESLQGRDPETGFATGRVDMNAAIDLFNKEFKARVSLRGPELMEAIQAVGQKTLRTPGKTQLTESDFADAQKYYTQSELLDTQYPVGDKAGSTLTAGGINTDGEYVFDVTDDELKEVGFREAIDKRLAFKEYAEQTANRAFQQIVVQDEQDRILANREANRLLEEERIADEEALKNIPSPFTPIKPFMGKGTYKYTEDGVKYEVTGDMPKVKASLGTRKYAFTISGDVVKSTLDEQGKEVKDVTGELDGDIKIEVENLAFNPKTGDLEGFDIVTGPGVLENAILSIEGTPLKSIYVQKGQPAFEEIRTSMEQFQAGSKNKRSGAQFLSDAENNTKLSLDIEPLSQDSIDRHNNYLRAMQSVTRSLGSDVMVEIADTVEGLDLREKIEMEKRIFDEVSKGNMPSIKSGRVLFEE